MFKIARKLASSGALETINVNSGTTRKTHLRNIKRNLDRIDKENISLLAKGEESLKVPTNDNVRHPVNRRAEIRPLN